jgi:hypothetical protein
MTNDKFQQLVQNHPELFQKAGDIEFSISDGWFNIIDTLCGLISHNLESAKRQLKYALENPSAKMSKSVKDLETLVDKERDELPVLVQVKEKFGTLRFYYDGGTMEIDNYVTFAESLTHRTCEVCGSPGVFRNDGWVRVLCDKHYKKECPSTDSKKKSGHPKLSDES